MNKGCIIALGAGGLIFVIILVLVGMIISAANQEVDLSTAIVAKQKDNKNEMDNMVKKISQVAQVSQKQIESVKEIIIGYADARKGGESDNLIMNWIKEAVPNVDTSTFNNLQNIIVSSRDAFTMRQKELLDLSREHNRLLKRFPSGMILSMIGRKAIDIQIVTSSRTEDAFKTGKDDDDSVFKDSKVEKK